MDLRDKVAHLPTVPGVYQYLDAHGTILYVGKAKNLRSRVSSYFTKERLADAKTGSLIREAADLSFIQVDTEKEALALENTLIKQHQPRFNVLLKDDKTYPYIKVTSEKWPRVYVTRKILKDGAQYFGPYFPSNLAWRLLHTIHRTFRLPSCWVDLKRDHPRPCLQYHIHRCTGPCVKSLVTEEAYAAQVRDVRLFLQGRHRELAGTLTRRMEEAAEGMEFERAAALRDMIRTVEEVEQVQKVASASDDNADLFAFHAEPPLLAVNLFHLRSGHIVDRREFFWEDQQEFEPAEFFSSLLKQYYLNAAFVPAQIHIPVDFEDRDTLEEFLSERRGRKVEILTPQRGTKKALLNLVETNARNSFTQRFRVLQPSIKATQDALQEALSLPEAPKRIECFDISHIQGTDKVASMVVWEDGRMKKSDYRKFIIKTVQGNDDFASMREVVHRRYSRLLAEGQPMPSLVLIDGGLGQLHAAAETLTELGIINQPVASIAKREEWIYVLGQESEPVILDRHNPVLHLIQTVRDEAHRFAVTFHRTRRNASRLTSELEQVPGVGKKTVEKLLREFGSPERVRQTSEEQVARVVGKAAARKVKEHLGESAGLVQIG